MNRYYLVIHLYTRYAPNSLKYLDRPGPTKAFTAVVQVRSYSRICGATSEEAETKISGYMLRMISADRRSFSGFLKENRKQMAIAPTRCFSINSFNSNLRRPSSKG